MKRKGFRIICILIVLVICLGAITFRYTRPKSPYTNTPLVTSDGKMFSPQSINDHGHVVGLVRNSAGQREVVLLGRNRGGQDVVCFGGFRACPVIEINSSCQVAGEMLDPNGVRRAFLWDSQNGLKLLDTLGGSESGVYAINNDGLAVGYSQTAAGDAHAVMWTRDSGPVDLGTLGGKESHACSVNDNGQIVGLSQLGSGQWHAFFYDPNTAMTDIGPTSISWLEAGCIFINNKGLVAGRFGSGRNAMLLSTWSVETGVKALPSFKGIEVIPKALDDSGRLLVYVISKQMTRLSEKCEKYLWIPDRGFVCIHGYANSRLSGRIFLESMNNRGQIVGTSPEKSGKHSGFLLEPIAEDPNE